MPTDTQSIPSEMHTFTHGSGNVFADLGIPNPEIALVKADLVIALQGRLETLGLTHADASKTLGIPEDDLASLLRGRTSAFDLDRVLGMLRKLGCDIDISVRPANEAGEGRIFVDIPSDGSGT